MVPYRKQPGAKPYERGELVCDRCGRRVTGWPLRRADVCAVQTWRECIREPVDVLESWKHYGFLK